MLPATCAPDVIEQNNDHFTVEFRTWILTAARETAAAGTRATAETSAASEIRAAT